MQRLAYLGIGSNLGDSRAQVEQAIAMLGSIPDTMVLARSGLFRTAPVGGPSGQPDYLNGCLSLATSLAPTDLLSAMRGIESHLGRERTIPNGPRTLDLDLLLFEQEIVAKDLQIPHPRMHNRSFVLRPLVQIAPYAMHPVLKKTMTDLLHDLEGISEAVPYSALSLAGKKILVTGSTSGIGLATAIHLASQGAGIVFHGRKPSEAVTPFLNFCHNATGFSRYIQGDLADSTDRQNIVEKCWDITGGLDGVFLNAGADILTGEFGGKCASEKFQRLLKVDLESTFELARAFGARMKKNGSGTILTMGWDQATHGMAGDSGEMFGAVKGAIMDFSKSLALSLAPEVRVVCIAPGWIRTSWGKQASEYWQRRAVAECPLNRWGKPEDIANTAHWLFSQGADFITGQVIRVNGGVVRD